LWVAVSKLLIATTNPGKIREINMILAGLPIELVTLGDINPIDAPEETGHTFAENARQKAMYYAAASGLPTVAEDSGLEIDALNGAPGVVSARYGGEDSTYPEKFALIYESLRAKNQETSTARFVAALALVDGNRVLFETQGAVEGTIAPEPKGSGGFGYDPIFYYAPFGCTFGEAGERKSAVSHRAVAFRALREYLNKQ